MKCIDPALVTRAFVGRQGSYPFVGPLYLRLWVSFLHNASGLEGRIGDLNIACETYF
jgi:hypothetical protein